jgi:hypothetical protein
MALRRRENPCRTTAPSPAVDGPGESAYARGSFDMFEVSSAGIALARADRTFCRLWSGPTPNRSGRRAWEWMSVEIGAAGKADMPLWSMEK